MNRGDVHEFRPPRGTRGHEQRGKRFGVVLQSSDLSALSTVVVAPTSVSAARSWLRPEIELRGRITRVLVPQLAAVDRSRLGTRAGRLSADEALAVEEALRGLFALR